MTKVLSTCAIFIRAILVCVCMVFVSATIYAKPTEPIKYDIEGCDTGVEGTYVVKVYIYINKKSKVTVKDFKYAAVHGVIFRGFRGKGLSLQKPMASAVSEQEHSEFYSPFFKNGDYAAYAEIVNGAADRIRVSKKEYKVAAVVSVSKDNLRKALESAGVIRSLNSGF